MSVNDNDPAGGCQFVSSVDGRRVTEDDTFYCGDIVDVEVSSFHALVLECPTTSFRNCCTFLATRKWHK